jgi:acetyltransferase-like isoleucine patch superfamily enzyme
MSLRFFISFLSIAFHFVFIKIKVFGSNKIKLSVGVLFWNSKISIKGKNNCILLGENVNLKKTKIVINGNNNKIVISDYVKIYEYCEFLIEGDNCEIYIGEKTTIGSGHIFCGESNTSIKIGDNCMLSREIFMNTSDFHSIIDTKSNLRINTPKNIILEDNVWLGFNTTINKGAVVGKYSVVATAAIVSGKNYPSNVILAGIPAKIIKENVTWSREKLPF